MCNSDSRNPVQCWLILPNRSEQTKMNWVSVHRYNSILWRCHLIYGYLLRFHFLFSSARIPLYERQTNKTQQTRQILHYTVPWLTARLQLLGPSNERFSCISFLRETYLSPVKRSGLFSKYTYVPIGCSSLLRISSRIADRMGQLSRINDVYDTVVYKDFGLYDGKKS